MLPLTPDEVVGAHALFGSAASLVDRRRTLYRAAIELASDGELAASVSVDVLDDPAVRGHVGALLSGTAGLERHRLRRTESVRPSGAVARPRVASSRSAERALGPALARIRGALPRGATGGAVLTAGDSEFGSALATVARGITLARVCAPGLVADLLPHVDLLAVVGGRGSASLGSASVPEFPGLVVVPNPGSPIEVAEALVHEGAHQKFFDLAMTSSMMDAGRPDQPTFRSSWAPTDAPSWPFGQCVAAFHAYTSLAAFAPEVARLGVSPHDHSLLPHAAGRAAEIARWLGRHADLLGRDGRRLLSALSAEPVTPIGADAGPTGPELAATDRIVERRCGPWKLVLRAASPVDIWWVPTTPARVR
jgi:HEXXH motif-containing protein